MQILGILDANGTVIPNVTVTMFTSDEDEAAINSIVDNREIANAKRSGAIQFNRTRAKWDAEFECHKDRLKEQIIDSMMESARMAGGKRVSRHEMKPDIRVFPLEVREYANNRTVYQRLVEHGIGV